MLLEEEGENHKHPETQGSQAGLHAALLRNWLWSVQWTPLWGSVSSSLRLDPMVA